MQLTEAEKKWVSENMREDFTIGFSKKLRFVDDEVWDIEGHIPTDEAETDGYFCMKCGGVQIPDVEEHVRECMHLDVNEDSEQVYILYREDTSRWLIGPFKTIGDALSIAKKSNRHSSIITLHGATIQEEKKA